MSGRKRGAEGWRLAGSAVERSSGAGTWAPGARRASKMWEPKNPGPPVTRTRIRLSTTFSVDNSVDWSVDGIDKFAKVGEGRELASCRTGSSTEPSDRSVRHL